jgi:hypothetical protein
MREGGLGRQGRAFSDGEGKRNGDGYEVKVRVERGCVKYTGI